LLTGNFNRDTLPITILAKKMVNRNPQTYPTELRGIELVESSGFGAESRSSKVILTIERSIAPTF
jgi:hypothetical protein